MALSPWDREILVHAVDIGIRLRLKEFHWHRPRQWGACWLAFELWVEKKPPSWEGTGWSDILQTFVCYRPIAPCCEWKLNRQWFEQSAMGDLLGHDYALGEKNALYRMHYCIWAHKRDLFDHLTDKWRDVFGPTLEVPVNELTSTYFEIDAPSSSAATLSLKTTRKSYWKNSTSNSPSNPPRASRAPQYFYPKSTCR